MGLESTIRCARHVPARLAYNQGAERTQYHVWGAELATLDRCDKGPLRYIDQ